MGRIKLSEQIRAAYINNPSLRMDAGNRTKNSIKMVHIEK